MTGTDPQKVQKPLDSNTRQSATFKYYIHDTSAGYSLEMSGPFTGSSVPELACCWQTAKPTLKDRTLTLDLRRLTSVDESARQWLIAMNEEGARYLPESFMQDTGDSQPIREEFDNRRVSLFVRLSNALRGFA